MKFVSIRDLRNQPGRVWKGLREDEVVLTSRGKPKALMVRVEEDDLEELLREVRRSRSRIVTERLREQARRSGASELSDEAIEELVRETRADTV